VSTGSESYDPDEVGLNLDAPCDRDRLTKGGQFVRWRTQRHRYLTGFFCHSPSCSRPISPLSDLFNSPCQLVIYQYNSYFNCLWYKFALYDGGPPEPVSENMKTPLS